MWRGACEGGGGKERRNKIGKEGRRKDACWQYWGEGVGREERSTFGCAEPKPQGSVLVHFPPLTAAVSWTHRNNVNAWSCAIKRLNHFVDSLSKKLNHFHAVQMKISSNSIAGKGSCLAVRKWSQTQHNFKKSLKNHELGLNSSQGQQQQLPMKAFASKWERPFLRRMTNLARLTPGGADRMCSWGYRASCIFGRQLLKSASTAVSWLQTCPPLRCQWAQDKAQNLNFWPLGLRVARMGVHQLQH